MNAPLPPKKAAPEGHAAKPKVKSILIINANLEEGGMIRNSLEACGYEVSVWTSIEGARVRYRDRTFTLVALSTNLGEEAIGEMLKEFRSKRPGKVIMIADENEGDVPVLAFLPMVVVVNRPFQLSEVADIVQHLIGNP